MIIVKIAIVNDLTGYGDDISTHISNYLEINKIVGEIEVFKSGEEFLKYFESKKFTVVFLDIIMDRISGLAVAKEIRKRSDNLPIVFITAIRECALKSHEMRNFDYLIKPFKEDRIFDIMNRVRAEKQIQRYIEFKENNITKRILLDDIKYIETKGYYIEIRTIEEILKIYMTFHELLGILPEDQRFQNCTSGCIINFDWVERLEDQVFIMKEGKYITICRKNKSLMKSIYGEYLLEKKRMMMW